jgi:hypothetical protein
MKLFTGVCIALFLILFFRYTEPAEMESNLDGLRKIGSSVSWKAEDDSGAGAASITSGEIVTEGDRKIYQWKYSLQKTEKFEWPFCSLNLEKLPFGDFSRWDGIILTVKGSRSGMNLTTGLIATDSKLNSWKPLGYVIKISDEYVTYKIPFSKLKIMYWWLAEHPGNSGKREFDRITAVYLSTSSTSGDKATVSISEIALYRGKGRGIVPGDIAAPVVITQPLGMRNSGKAQTVITVNPDMPFRAPYSNNNGKINPRFWGTNWAQWLNSFPDARLTKNMKVKLIRVGGNFMSRYNWHNSFFTSTGSSRAKPQPTMEAFVAWCRSVGAEPLIQINAMGWAPSDKPGNPMENCMTEKDAAHLVTYLNGIKKLGVKYFEIDNEFDLWGITHRDVWKSGAVTGKEYADIFIRYSVAMKKAQGAISKSEDIKILGPVNCIAWNGWKTLANFDDDGEFDSFPPYFLKVCAEYERTHGMRILDIYSFHFYSSYRPDYNDGKRFIPEGLPAMLESVQVWWNQEYVNRYDQAIPRGKTWAVIPQYRKWIAENYPGTELAITEFNLDAASQIIYEPGLREIWQADLYGIMAKYGVDYALQFSLNSDDLPMGMINQYDDVNPGYWIYRMYSGNFTGTVVQSGSDRPEILNVYSCIQDSGNLVIMVVNKDTRQDWTAVVILGQSGSAILERTFPRMSLTCIKIPKNRNKAEVTVYGLEQITGNK